MAFFDVSFFLFLFANFTKFHCSWAGIITSTWHKSFRFNTLSAGKSMKNCFGMAFLTKFFLMFWLNLSSFRTNKSRLDSTKLQTKYRPNQIDTCKTKLIGIEWRKRIQWLFAELRQFTRITAHDYMIFLFANSSHIFLSISALIQINFHGKYDLSVNTSKLRERERENKKNVEANILNRINCLFTRRIIASKLIRFSAIDFAFHIDVPHLSQIWWVWIRINIHHTSRST